MRIKTGKKLSALIVDYYPPLRPRVSRFGIITEERRYAREIPETPRIFISFRDVEPSIASVKMKHNILIITVAYQE
ncbi:MAG: hypothetical protein Q6363_004110 [Candidatus Njordarchaeota archaeon]